jgi:Flp pilus assembly protein TadD
MKATFLKNLLLGIGVNIIIFILIELVLMAAGVTPLYKRTDPSVGFSGYAPLFVKKTQPNGEEVFETAHNKYEWFNRQRFPARKADDVFRIFCIGGSTTYGRPYDDRTSFGGWLRLLLPAVDSSRRWEVINAGGISYASYRAARLMEELAAYDPDLFIVYSGHNEFLEARTYKKLLEVPGFVRSLGVQASRSRLYTLLYDLFNKPSEILPTEVDALLDRSVGPEDYHRDDEMRDAVLEDYHTSLLRMTQISEHAGTKMIFISPSSNIGDFSPFKSEPGPNLSAQELTQVDTLKKIVAMALDTGDYFIAEAKAREALTIDHRDAELLFMHGRALRALDHTDEARMAFIRARDEDVCPLRALTPIREIVAEVAQTKSTGFVDFVDIVYERSPDGIPGSELFLDHVHPTIEGNRLLALSIMEEMKREGIISQTATWNEVLIAEISNELEKSLDEKTHAIALRNLSKVLGWAGKDEEAKRLASLAVETIPEDSESHTQKGLLLWRGGDREAALAHLREAERLDPKNANIRRRLGILLSELGRMDEARAELEEAIRLDPDLSEVHYDLGIVLESLGMLKQAEAAYRTALKQDPNHAEAHNNLGVVLAMRGNLEAAAEAFARALELDPDYEEAAVNLAQASKALGKDLIEN